MTAESSFKHFVSYYKRTSKEKWLLEHKILYIKNRLVKFKMPQVDDTDDYDNKYYSRTH